MKTMMEKTTATNGKGGVKMVAAIIVAVIIVALAAGGIYKMARRDGDNRSPKVEGYQAVFLSNGQVYFGKVTNLERDYAELSDVYYLMRKTPLQTQVPVEGDAAAAAQQSQLTLIKLGNEIHGPKDAMILNQKHILFVENLKDDSKIVAAINDYKTKQANEQK
jgi:hypothetical protein